MDTVHAIYENGSFRPLEPVAIPEGAQVAFEPRVVRSPQQGSPDKLHQLLRQSESTGQPDLAARHNEHQP